MQYSNQDNQHNAVPSAQQREQVGQSQGSPADQQGSPVDPPTSVQGTADEAITAKTPPTAHPIDPNGVQSHPQIAQNIGGDELGRYSAPYDEQGQVQAPQQSQVPAQSPVQVSAQAQIPSQTPPQLQAQAQAQVQASPQAQVSPQVQVPPQVSSRSQSVDPARYSSRSERGRYSHRGHDEASGNRDERHIGFRGINDDLSQMMATLSNDLHHMQSDMQQRLDNQMYETQRIHDELQRMMMGIQDQFNHSGNR